MVSFLLLPKRQTAEENDSQLKKMTVEQYQRLFRLNLTLSSRQWNKYERQQQHLSQAEQSREVCAPVFVWGGCYFFSRGGGPFQFCLPQRDPQPAAAIPHCREGQWLREEPVNPIWIMPGSPAPHRGVRIQEGRRLGPALLRLSR